MPLVFEELCKRFDQLQAQHVRRFRSELGSAHFFPHFEGQDVAGFDKELLYDSCLPCRPTKNYDCDDESPLAALGVRFWNAVWSDSKRAQERRRKNRERIAEAQRMERVFGSRGLTIGKYGEFAWRAARAA
jgi:hypothetical protein